jgi:hypothetical protein
VIKGSFSIITVWTILNEFPDDIDRLIDWSVVCLLVFGRVGRERCECDGSQSGGGGMATVW